ncbi:MAG TPA: GMC family oxidoreductase N-terminal domain-containing protein [Burkholderiaceae bacterium]|nr:GMC family oxidoreductase N-terminal domain-containing protein [Burkholderiaceae bacterium]
MEEFDYVVLGGGSGGCTVAGRLSEDDARSVLLLEAGGDGTSWVVKVPMAAAISVPTAINNWALQTVPQRGLDGRRGYQPRGRGLGGSSAINAMVYTRGHATDYDDWAAAGADGWAFADVLPYFKRAENNEQFELLDPAFHGQGGPLNVAALRTDNPFHGYFADAVREAGLPWNADFNGAVQDGLGAYQVTQKGGERCSAARGYIHPHLGKRRNLAVVCRARGRRILFDGRRAVGVEYERDGRVHVARARHEVILSAGALHTPQILMLSGVGDPAELRRTGIALVHELPGVGRNLQDHPDFVFSFESATTDLVGLSLRGAGRLLREISRFRTQRRGMLTTNYAELGGFLRTRPDLTRPDIQLHFTVAIVDDHARALFRTFRLPHGFSLHMCLLRPRSRGRVTLASADPRAAPLIDPDFLGDPRDVDDMVAGFRLARRLLDAPALARRTTRDLHTAGISSDEEIRAVLRQRVDTIYHPVGTCRMGTDPDAVVDPQLRVHGIEGLRIVDASVMPTLVGGNTNAPTIMIGEKAADLIRGA